MIKKVELTRKSIHLLTLVIPLGYVFLTRNRLLVITGFLVGVSLVVEALRFWCKSFSSLFNRKVGRLLRKHEKNDLTGATYLVIGSFLSILLFEKWIAMSVLFFLIISDGMSALVGRIWGKYRIYGKKTVEGSVTFLVTATAIVYFMPGSNFLIGFAGVIAALLMDIFIIKVDDNLTIPLVGGGVMQILSCLKLTSNIAYCLHEFS